MQTKQQQKKDPQEVIFVYQNQVVFPFLLSSWTHFFHLASELTHLFSPGGEGV